MKILLVAIPNHHFFQWVNQLENSGFEVAWLDSTDGNGFSNKIKWVKQYNGWKLKSNYPLRSRIKKRLPKLYQFIQRFNERKLANVFEQILNEFQPDIVHCFEMQLAGFPILDVMEKQSKIPFIYSSWGSDLFYFKEMGVANKEIKRFLNRTNYLITDCKRDYEIAQQNGFQNDFLGVFPGNGGISIPVDAILPTENRDTILIKGYDDGVGKASLVLDAIERLPKNYFANYKIVIYSAEESIINQIKQSNFLSNLNYTIYPRTQFFPNAELLKIMGKSCIHIANSISDGMPNALLEAMGMGAFPIQSNPGKVTEEVIINGKNGFLIENPLDVNQISTLIREALDNQSVRKRAQDYNSDFINKNYNRLSLRPKIVKLYPDINQ